MNLLRMRLKKLSRSGRTQDLAVVAFVEVCLKHGRLPRKKDIPRTTPPDVLFYLINTLRHKRGITPLRKPRMWLHELMPYVSYPLCDYHQLSDIVQDLSTRAIALQSYRSASEI